MLKVVKIGGNVIDDAVRMSSFLDYFVSLEGDKILVHGGGKIATDVAQGLGVQAMMVGGRRVTDSQMLKIVTMVYGGLINKNIVSKLQYLGCNAIGLTGADGAFITSQKRSPEPVDYGYVGDPVGVNSEMAKMLINNGLTPVVAPLTYCQGGLLNTNADTMAQTVATAMAKIYPTELIFMFEKRGVLRDVDDPNSVIELITPEIFEQLKDEKIVDKGMLPKLENAFRAIEMGVESVRIGQTKICNTI